MSGGAFLEAGDDHFIAFGMESEDAALLVLERNLEHDVRIVKLITPLTNLKKLFAVYA